MDILRLLKIALLVAATAALTTATVLMVTQARVPAVAVGPTPCIDGDANGDSSLDIGDPIYLLGHLFGGGPAPVACAQNPPSPVAFALSGASDFTFTTNDPHVLNFQADALSSGLLNAGGTTVTISEAGPYWIAATAHSPAPSTPLIILDVVKNGAIAFTSIDTEVPQLGQAHSASVSALLPLLAGDTLQFQVRIVSGSPGATITGDGSLTHASGFLVR